MNSLYKQNVVPNFSLEIPESVGGKTDPSTDKTAWFTRRYHAGRHFPLRLRRIPQSNLP